MENINKVAVLGCGSWGTALAQTLAEKDLTVRLWGRDKKLIDTIKETRENKKYLQGIRLHQNITLSNNLASTLEDISFIVLAVPSHALRETVKLISSYIHKHTILVNTAKGLENKTLLRLSQVMEEEIQGKGNIAVLSGPSHAEEVGKLLPTAVVASAKDISIAETVQDVFMSPSFRVYTNPDLCGVEIGGALKNIIALATGISDGLGFGDNTRAALMTRGLSEIVRLGTTLGGQPSTFAGLAGIGDLIVTCNSMHSRNRRAGILLGEGYAVDEVLSKVGMVVEGIKTTKIALELAKLKGVPMPITEEIAKVIFGEKKPNESVSSLMERQKKHETEEIFLNYKF